MTEMDEIRSLHARYGAADVGLSYADDPRIPEGWRIVLRCWMAPRRFVHRGMWDALIRPPAPKIGWALDGDMAPGRKKALKRAIAEIQAHIAEEG